MVAHPGWCSGTLTPATPRVGGALPLHSTPIGMVTLLDTTRMAPTAPATTISPAQHLLLNAAAAGWRWSHA